MSVCPKCGAKRPQDAAECPQCGIIYARHEAAQAKQREEMERRHQEAEAARAAAQAAARAQQEQVTGTMLVKCAACGKAVSVMADSCPHCGHPVDKMLRLSPVERTLTQAWQLALGVFLLLAVAGVSYCSHKLSTPGGLSATPPAEPAPVHREKPGVRTNVPITISAEARVIGCHDINDFWMVEGFRRGGDKTWIKLLRERVEDGRCGRAATGRGIAVEILPTGVVEIRDSKGVKWYVTDDTLKQNGAYYYPSAKHEAGRSNTIAITERTPGCRTVEEFRKLADIAASKDDAAFGKALVNSIAAGRCTLLEPGAQVYREDSSLRHGAVKVRVAGETESWWINMK